MLIGGGFSLDCGFILPEPWPPPMFENLLEMLVLSFHFRSLEPEMTGAKSSMFLDPTHSLSLDARNTWKLLL